jgi:hypothetical protein
MNALAEELHAETGREIKIVAADLTAKRDLQFIEKMDVGKRRSPQRALQRWNQVVFGRSRLSYISGFTHRAHVVCASRHVGLETKTSPTSGAVKKTFQDQEDGAAG